MQIKVFRQHPVTLPTECVAIKLFLQIANVKLRERALSWNGLSNNSSELLKVHSRVSTWETWWPKDYGCWASHFNAMIMTVKCYRLIKVLGSMFVRSKNTLLKKLVFLIVEQIVIGWTEFPFIKYLPQHAGKIVVNRKLICIIYR